MKFIDNFIEKFNLENTQKRDLIQTLLIVSSILVAFKGQENLTTTFMIFIFLSINYYIYIQNDKLEPNKYSDIIVLIIAATFSTIVNFNLFVSFWNDLKNFSITIGIFLYLAYFSILTIILWAALVKRSYHEKRIFTQK